MRVKLHGLRTTQELRAMLHESIDQIEALGITHLSGCNLYVTPSDSKGNIVVRIGHTPIEDLEIKEPYQSAAEEHGL